MSAWRAAYRARQALGDFDWTPEAIAKLRELWAAGYSARQCGVAVGVSKSAIVGKAHRLGLPPRPSPIRRLDGGAIPSRRHQDRLRAKARAAGEPEPDFSQPRRPQRAPAPALVAERPDVHEAPPADRKTAASDCRCCWPLGEPRAPDFRYCGAPVERGSYCGEHAKVAYVARKPRGETERMQFSW